MAKRHSDAWAIQQGACNPSGVARSLVEAIDEARSENPSTDAVCADAAVRLICHQLASLLNVAAIDNGLDDYGRLLNECAVKSREPA